MNKINPLDLPPSLRAILSTTYVEGIFATPKSRPGGRAFTFRMETESHVYRFRKGKWTLVKTY